MPDFNPDYRTSWILFVDDNNLYGHALSQPLPRENFQFLSLKEIEEFDIAKTVATDNIGFILDVDLMYPVYLHESHNDYPLAAEKVKITQDMLTPYSKSLINKHSSTEKLAPNQKDKINYVLHYENLRLYLELEIIQQNEKSYVILSAKLVQTVYIQRVWQNNGMPWK